MFGSRRSPKHRSVRSAEACGQRRVELIGLVPSQLALPVSRDPGRIDDADRHTRAVQNLCYIETPVAGCLYIGMRRGAPGRAVLAEPAEQFAELYLGISEDRLPASLPKQQGNVEALLADVDP